MHLPPITWPYACIGIFSLADIFLGGYVLLKNHRRTLNRVFGFFAWGMGLIGGSMALLSATHLLIFDRTIFMGGYLMIFGLVLLSVEFPTGRPIKHSFWIIFLPLMLLAGLTPFGFIVREVIFRPDGILQPIHGPGIHFFVPTIATYILFSIWNFRQNFRLLSGVARLQMQYFLFGAGIFIFCTFICDVLLPGFGIFKFNLIGPLSSVVFVGTIAYAIVRHRLLDIRVIIQRGALYVILVILISAFYLALVFAIGDILHDVFDRADAVFLAVELITVCIGLLTVPFIERFFRRLTDKVFFKEKYHYP